MLSPAQIQHSARLRFTMTSASPMPPLSWRVSWDRSAVVSRTAGREQMSATPCKRWRNRRNEYVPCSGWNYYPNATVVSRCIDHERACKVLHCLVIRFRWKYTIPTGRHCCSGTSVVLEFQGVRPRSRKGHVMRHASSHSRSVCVNVQQRKRVHDSVAELHISTSVI